MRVSLVNPNWSFEQSVFFGCREPHLPLEFGYSQALLAQEGHDVLLLDAHLLDLNPSAIQAQLKAFAPELIVLTTAPGYLSWTRPPLDLTVPSELIGALRGLGAAGIVGPHASTTPAATLARLEGDLAILGEPEQVLLKIAAAPPRHWLNVLGCRA